jgi:hypothetical protein
LVKLKKKIKIMKKFDYTTGGIQKARAGMMMETGPDAIMKYGGGCGCGKTMPKYSNNPRTIQGRQLRKGGSV